MATLTSNRNHYSLQFILGLVTVALLIPDINAFVAPNYRRIRNTVNTIHRKHNSPLSMAFELQDISDLYRSYPLESAIATCGIKGSLADITAQIRSWKGEENDEKNRPNTIEMSRNTVQIIYGGLIGVLCHLMYDEFYPAFFGTSKAFDTVLTETLLDVFVVGPLVWLPPAYLIKAILTGDSFRDGLKSYIDDIRNEGLLLKYWSVWIPAEACTFGLIPDHLRVAFFASVSFFWFIILSTVSFKEEKDEIEVPRMNTGRTKKTG